MLANKIFSTLHVTCHKSLKEAIKLITKEKLVEVITIGHKHMLKVKKTEPRIAVCGLNPHAGENGIFGSEEINEIIPAVELLKKKGLNIVGPISPDIIFRQACLKMISGDIGPTIFRPFFFKSSTAGIISLISSDPKIPFSPAWGFNPHTAILGSVFLTLSICLCPMVITSTSFSFVISFIASLSDL